MVDADWLQGRNSNGQVGIFPSNYVSYEAAKGSHFSFFYLSNEGTCEAENILTRIVFQEKMFGNNIFVILHLQGGRTALTLFFKKK